MMHILENKLLPILLVVVLSGCATVGGRMESRIMYAEAVERAYEKCKQDNSLMIEYVDCIHEKERELGKQKAENAPFGHQNQDRYAYEQLLMRSRLAKKYHMVIAEEVDAGKASWSKGEAEIATINHLLLERQNAAQKLAADEQFMKSLQFLDIYSKAIERTTLQR